MGLFKKFRSDEKRSTLKTVPPSSSTLSVPAKSSSNSESSGETSEFSLATSQLSHSSQDTNKRHLDLIPRKPPPAATAAAVSQLHRHLLQPRISPGSAIGPTSGTGQLARGRALMPPQQSATVPNSPAHTAFGGAGAGSAGTRRVSHLASTSMLSTVPMPFYPTTQPDDSFTSASTSAETLADLALDEDEAKQHPYYDQWKQYYAAMAGYKGPRQQQYAYQYPPQQYQPPRTASSSRRASFAGVSTGPYQQGQNGSLSSLSHNNLNGLANGANGANGASGLHGLNGSANQSTCSIPANSYMHYYQAHEARGVENSGLVRNSRMSTLKLNRSSSAPSLANAQDPRNVKNRAISVNVTTPGLALRPPDALEEDDALEENSAPLDGDSAVPSALAEPSTKTVSFGLAAMANQEGEVGDFEPVKPPGLNSRTHTSSTLESAVSTLTNEQGETPGPLVREDSAISDYGKYLFNSTLDSNDQDDTVGEPSGDQDMNVIDPGVHAAILAANPEPPASHISHNKSSSVSRNDSCTSKSSYNSLQSESNFSVGRKPSRIATQSEQQRKLSRTQGADRRFLKQRGFRPPMPGPPPPIFTGLPGMPPSPSSLTFGSPMMPYGGSTENIPPEGAAFQLQQMQQQIQQLQQMQQQQMQMNINMGNQRNSRVSLSPQPQPRSSDPTINAKIEEFIQLRQTIAAGHKTFDFRLKWAKMLITAVNYKLYAYVNIKGDNVPSEHAAMNKLTFVKLAVTHLQKMLKELDVEKHTPQDRRIFAEVCYIHGCLLMHDYVPKYEQDFNIQQDKDEADRFFRKCLELNPLFFRAHYRLAVLFEEDQTEESFDTALYHYTQAAKLGYNRAIYQVALIYLTVPKSRLLKFFKYLKSLSDIDMDSKDIKLSPEDREELEEVSGLASFQLAKIYEGIYPGDLTPDDEFVQSSLEVAPVNYAKSLSYYNRAARLHCLQAQVRLGHIYENGDLNRKYNPNKSIQWFIKAATSPLKFKRHPEAMLGLSRWFLIGTNGLSKYIPYPDPQGSLMWAERACKEFSFPEAFYAMGQLAEQGLAQGDPQEWYMEAYNLGFAEAATKLPGYQPPEVHDTADVEAPLEEATHEEATYVQNTQGVEPVADFDGTQEFVTSETRGVCFDGVAATK